MDVRIREADAGCVPSLDVLRRQAIEAAFEERYDRSTVADLVATGSDELRARVDADRFDVRLAETEVTVVAYGVLDRRTCQVESLFTSPDYQTEGFASHLLARLAEAADCDELEAVAPEPAVPFFESVGFEVVDDAEWHGLPGRRLRQRP